MKDERETRKKLLASAKKEFLEKGYAAASLRSICKQAEVTTGALYFFFKDKADLFKSLVEEPLQKVYAAMMAHYREEAETAPQTLPEHLSDSRDFQTALEIIHYMYQYYDECLLVLTKAQGSGFENFVDRLVDITKQHYRELADRYCRMFQQPLLDDYTVRWMAHMHVDMFVHLITHERSEAAACRHMEQMIYYLSCGFFAMIQNPPRNPDVELPEHSNTGNKT